MTKKEIYETLRLQVSKDFIAPTCHGLFCYDKDGKETEQKFDTTIFLEMI